jgi:hypothetical protein
MARGEGPRRKERIVIVTAASRVHDVLLAHPRTGETLMQCGRLFRTRRGDLYPAYDPELTIGAFAAENHVDLASLLSTLNAVAEDEEGPSRSPRPAATPAVLGYTGSYQEPKVEADSSLHVEVQERRGPV